MEQCLLVPCAPHSKVFADCTEHSTHVQMLNTVRCPQGKLDCKVQIMIGCESQSGQYEGRTGESQDVSEGVPEDHWFDTASYIPLDKWLVFKIQVTVGLCSLLCFWLANNV